jgi:RNA polymerase sigma-70 factor (ECF subfamily)
MELFYIDDFSYEEIVNITGLPLGTVKTRLNRGRTQLREALLKRLPDAEKLYEA